LAYKVGIIGASGYGGAEILRLLANRPEYKIEVVTADSQKNKRITDLYPHLTAYSQNIFQDYKEVKSALDGCDLVFCSLPHGEAMKLLPDLKSKCLVDLGGYFRLQDPQAYEKWYGTSHTAKSELKNWTYGLTEIFREEISKSSRIANPGCYPTAATMAIWPLLKNSLI